MWSGCGNYWRSCRDALRRRAGLRPSKFLRPTRKFYVLLVASQYVVVQSFANLKLADPKINALLGSTQSWSLRSSSLSGLATTNFANLFSLDYEVTNRRRRLFGNRLQRCSRASMTALEIAIDHWAQAGGKWPLRRFIERSLRLLRRFAETESAPTGTRKAGARR